MGGLFVVHSNTWSEDMAEMEPDSSCRCRVVGLESMDTSYFPGNSPVE